MRNLVLGSLLFLGLAWGSAQGPSSGHEILSALNAWRYREAFALGERSPQRYAQWVALMIGNALPPKADRYSPLEAKVRSAEYACRHASVNRESAAYCYHTLLLLLRERDFEPRLATLMGEASIPRLTRAEARERLLSLAKEGVPFALYSQSQGKEGDLRGLAGKHPHSLGGVLAASALSGMLWRRGEHREALGWALRGRGVAGEAEGVVAFAQYYGIGLGRDQGAACARALFWAKRTLADPAVYTLGLCHQEGAGGFPKDPALAYGIFWLGKNYSEYGFFIYRAWELQEKSLTRRQLKEGRVRAAEYLLQ